jgi:hypothetical protein
MEYKNLSLREKSILAGLYLSKFNEQGLKYLGFDTFNEAYNVIGLSLEIKPASIKNYRDEFDPHFPNTRAGWHSREMRPYVKKIFDAFKGLELDSFASLIKNIVYKDRELDILMEQIEGKKDKSSSFAKRLITGQAAEHYFEENYKNIEVFRDYEIENTTKIGCGFDFKLSVPNKDFIAVEVKGLKTMSGGLMMTDKEHSVAETLNSRYFLFIVKNFKENPFHEFYKNPLNSKLVFTKLETQIKQISWNTSI